MSCVFATANRPGFFPSYSLVASSQTGQLVLPKAYETLTTSFSRLVGGRLGSRSLYRPCRNLEVPYTGRLSLSGFANCLSLDEFGSQMTATADGGHRDRHSPTLSRLCTVRRAANTRFCRES